MNYSIGKLAELTGLTVKTIRFYSDEGVLPAPDRTPAGYRRYTDEHRVHLELIRTLREMGVDLATIRSLDRRGLKDVLALHLRAVETQLTALQRTRAVLRATLAKDDPGDDDLRRLHTLGRLGASEMGMLLDTFIDDVSGAPAQREWLLGMRACMAPELPEDPTAAQLDAWLELLDLLSDDGFRRNLREASADFWARPYAQETWERQNAALAQEALRAVEAGTPPGAPEAVPPLERVLVLMGGDRDAILRAFDEHDPRGARYWELVAIVRGLEPGPSPMAVAYDWIHRALRAHPELSPKAARTSG
ncbi:MerR family transcriptional regulator [Nonomuraea sp. MCN248]|uniref:MerR family transcriptional regulator n=1 Tax=Nonomuraea corallina TaxID=2989783 RepID=A0ABT4S609_9ACTN|nr:MerR family transcriptional regulator [Nonomuraea corallina]MDA0632633.1 MerR family transcriptional regulator [Nonomuraea corallina]